MIKFFGKKKKEETLFPEDNEQKGEQKREESPKEGGIVLPKDLNKSAAASEIIKGVYISEKATALSRYNQYIFKVFHRANKSEIAKAAGKLFKVKVKDVKMLNMPAKRKDAGRHPGFRPGFKKAIVVLEKGHTIEMVKP